MLIPIVWKQKSFFVVQRAAWEMIDLQLANITSEYNSAQPSRYGIENRHFEHETRANANDWDASSFHCEILNCSVFPAQSYHSSSRYFQDLVVKLSNWLILIYSSASYLTSQQTNRKWVLHTKNFTAVSRLPLSTVVVEYLHKLEVRLSPSHFFFLQLYSVIF